MKLLVDCMPLSAGGGVQVAVALLENLVGCADVEWQAVVPTQLQRALSSQLNDDPRVIFLKKSRNIDRVWIRDRLLALEAAFEPDVVFTVFGPAYFKARAPHVVGFALPNLIYAPDEIFAGSGRAIEPMIDWLRSCAFKRADHIVVETQVVKDRLVQHLNIDKATITVIANSVNPVLTALAKPTQQIDRLKPFSILVPSAYYKHKNLEIIPAVAAAIAEQSPDLNFEFRLTLGPEAPAWKAIHSAAVDRSIGHRVKSLGVLTLPQLGAAYGDASAVFLPTLREASTAVYPESFYFERPLITSDMDFARILCGNAAVYVPPKEARPIARALISLAYNPEQVASLIAAGHLQLQKTYPSSRDKFAQQLELFRTLALRPHDQITRKASSFADRFLPGAILKPGKSVKPIGNDAIQFHDNIAHLWDGKYLRGGFRRRGLWFAKHILPTLNAHGTWLDAGCGTGFFSRMLSVTAAEVVGVDASKAMIDEAQGIQAEVKNSGGIVNYKKVDTVERLPFEDAAFSGVVCLSVLEYLDHPLACLDELTRVLKPKGCLVISVPGKFSPIRKLQEIAVTVGGNYASKHVKYRFLSKFSLSKADLERELVRRGLKIKKMQYFDPVLPASLVSYIPASLIYVVAIK